MENLFLLLYILCFASGWSGMALLINGWQQSRRREALYFILLMLGMLLIQGELSINWYNRINGSAFLGPLIPWIDIGGILLIVSFFPRATILIIKDQLNKVEKWVFRLIPLVILSLGILFHIKGLRSIGGVFLTFFYGPLLYSLLYMGFHFSKIKDKRIKRFFRIAAITSTVFIPMIIFEALRHRIPWAEKLHFLEFLSLPLFFLMLNVQISLLGYPFLKDKMPLLQTEISKDFIQTYSITPRESEILPLFAQGKSYQEIAELMKISARTVDKHIENIYKKTLVSNRIELLHLLNSQ